MEEAHEILKKIIDNMLETGHGDYRPCEFCGTIDRNVHFDNTLNVLICDDCLRKVKGD